MSLGSLQHINYKTGGALTDHQKMHLDRISEACELLRLYMHEAEGSTPPGDHLGVEHIFMGERMKVANIWLEAAEMMARKAALE